MNMGDTHFRRNIKNEDRIKAALANGTEKVVIFMKGEEKGNSKANLEVVCKIRTGLIEIAKADHGLYVDLCLEVNRYVFYIHCFKAETAIKILTTSEVAGIPVSTRLIEKDLTTKYVIKRIKTQIPLTDIADGLESAGIVFDEIVRLTAGGKRPLCMVLVKELGNVKRDHVNIFNLTFKIEVYQEKPKSCTKCLGFGHYSYHCRKIVICAKCGDNHETDTCVYAKIKCVRCGADHDTFSKMCPIYIKQMVILKIMRNDNCISYKTALQYVETELAYEMQRPPGNKYAAENGQMDRSIEILLRMEERVLRDLKDIQLRSNLRSFDEFQGAIFVIRVLQRLQRPYG